MFSAFSAEKVMWMCIYAFGEIVIEICITVLFSHVVGKYKEFKEYNIIYN